MRVLLLIIALFISNLLTAQNDLIGKTLKSIVDIPAKEYDLINDNISSGAISFDALVESGLLFKIVDQKLDKLVIKLFKFSDTNSTTAKKYSNSEHYLINSENISLKTVSPKDIISVGVLTVPFKARPKTSEKDFAFSPEFNISSTLGLRLWKSWNYTSGLYLQFGIGVATVSLDENNSSISDPQNISALSTTTGLMFDFKGVQVGMYLGWDSISNNTNYNWVHQGDTWISFGIGFGLFDFGSGKN